MNKCPCLPTQKFSSEQVDPWWRENKVRIMSAAGVVRVATASTGGGHLAGAEGATGSPSSLLLSQQSTVFTGGPGWLPPEEDG